MDYMEMIDSLLKQHGAVLVRQKKHYVWRLPDGRIWVHSKTASDVRSLKNSYSDLCRLLGVKDVRRKNPERKPKTGVRQAVAELPGRDVTVRDLRSQIKLAVARSFWIQPKPCESAIWLESFPSTGLWTILRHIGRL
jgi:hypothetical protein